MFTFFSLTLCLSLPRFLLPSTLYPLPLNFSLSPSPSPSLLPSLHVRLPHFSPPISASLPLMSHYLSILSSSISPYPTISPAHSLHSCRLFLYCPLPTFLFYLHCPVFKVCSSESPSSSITHHSITIEVSLLLIIFPQVFPISQNVRPLAINKSHCDSVTRLFVNMSHLYNITRLPTTQPYLQRLKVHQVEIFILTMSDGFDSNIHHASVC